MTSYPRLAGLLCLLALPLAACGATPADPDAATSADTGRADDAFAAPGEDAFSPPLDAAVEPDAFSAPDAGPATVLFSRDVMPILSANCMGSGCHTNPSNMFLTTARTGCATVSEQRLVVPFDPASSYVVLKIEGAAGICGMRMPRGRTPLSASEIMTIRTWVAEGARNN